MVFVFVVGASGMLAACARPLTAVAPARTAAAPNRRLRVNMVDLLFRFTRRLRLPSDLCRWALDGYPPPSRRRAAPRRDRCSPANNHAALGLLRRSRQLAAALQSIAKRRRSAWRHSATTSHRRWSCVAAGHPAGIGRQYRNLTDKLDRLRALASAH